MKQIKQTNMHTSVSNLSQRSTGVNSANFGSTLASTLGDWGIDESSNEVCCIRPSHSSSIDDGSTANILSSVRNFLMFSLNLSEVLGSLSLLTLFPQFLEAGFRLNVVRREPPCRCVRILRSPPSVELIYEYIKRSYS